MGGPFDVTIKHLLEAYPEDWLRLVGVQASGPVEVIDADLATITAEADKVFRLAEPSPWMLHLEFQSSYDRDLPDRIHAYNTLLYRRHGVPVRSVVLLLRSAADGPAMNGVLRRQWPDGRQYLEFVYDVVRVWELPLEPLLAGGPGILPLVPLVDGAQSRLPEVVRQVGERLVNELARPEAAVLLNATYVLTGLKRTGEALQALFRRVHMLSDVLKDSSAYQAIIAEGRVDGARALLIKLGTKQFGPPNVAMRERLEQIADFDRLVELTDRLDAAGSWDELLGDQGGRTETDEPN